MATVAQIPYHDEEALAWAAAMARLMQREDAEILDFAAYRAKKVITTVKR